MRHQRRRTPPRRSSTLVRRAGGRHQHDDETDRRHGRRRWRGRTGTRRSAVAIRAAGRAGTVDQRLQRSDAQLGRDDGAEEGTELQPTALPRQRADHAESQRHHDERSAEHAEDQRGPRQPRCCGSPSSTPATGRRRPAAASPARSARDDDRERRRRPRAARGRRRAHDGAARTSNAPDRSSDRRLPFLDRFARGRRQHGAPLGDGVAPAPVARARTPSSRRRAARAAARSGRGTAARPRRSGSSSRPGARRPSAAVRPSSTRPRPPGVTGTADSSRTNENAASTSCQLTSASDTPTWRRATRSTANSERWLISVVTVIRTQRRSSSPMTSPRNAHRPLVPAVRRAGGRASAGPPRRPGRTRRRPAPAMVLAAQQQREQPDGDGRGRPARRAAATTSAGPAPPLRASRRERDDRQAELDEVVPDPRHDHGERGLRHRDAPRALHRQRHADAERAAAGHGVGHRRRRQVGDGGLPRCAARAGTAVSIGQ